MQSDLIPDLPYESQMRLSTAREHVIAASLSLMASKVHIEASPPGPRDDAALDLADEILNKALKNYIETLDDIHSAAVAARIADAESAVVKKPSSEHRTWRAITERPF